MINSKPHPQSSAPATASFKAVFNKPSGTVDSIIFLNASQRKQVRSMKPVETAMHGTKAVILTRSRRIKTYIYYETHKMLLYIVYPLVKVQFKLKIHLF